MWKILEDFFILYVRGKQISISVASKNVSCANNLLFYITHIRIIKDINDSWHTLHHESAQRSGFLWRRFLFSSASSTRLFWGRPMIRPSRHGNRRNWLMDDPQRKREERKRNHLSTREGMIDGIHYRETRAIRPHPEEPGSFLCPFSSSPPPYTLHPLTLDPFFIPYTRSCCLFLFLRCLSVCSTLMHLLAYRYNCRAIIKAGLSFSLPPIQPPFSLLPSLFIPLFLSSSISRPFLDPDSQCILQPFNLCPYSILFAITDPEDFEGKSRRINFCARISIGARGERRTTIGDEP